MGIERSYKIVQNRGKRLNKIDLPSHLLCITCVSMAFGGVLESLWHYGSMALWHYGGVMAFWNRFETPPSAIETQVIHRRWEGKSILLNLFPLF